MNYLSKLILGNKHNNVFEQRVFIIITFIGFLFGLSSTISDMIIHDRLILYLFGFSGSLVFLVLYIFARLGASYYILSPYFIITTLTLFSIAWFLYDGYNGGTPYNLILATVAFLIVCQQKRKILVLLLTSSVIISLFFIQKNNPDMINHFNSESERFWDMLIAILISLIAIFFISSRLIRQYHFEKERVFEEKNKIEQLNNVKDKFFSIISHDLRNPVGAYLNTTKILSEEFDEFTEEEKHTFVKSLYKSSQNLYSLLDNLLTWSRAQQGDIVYNPEVSGICEIANDTISTLLPAANAKDITIQNDIAPDLTAFFDKNMTTTILNNLVTNAIKFSNLGTQVYISAKKCDGEILISVRDQGIGINKSDHVMLFIPGHQHTQKGTAGETGSGLGLVLCKDFATIQGGRIWIESVPGQGTEINFTVPLSQTKDKKLALKQS